MRTFSELLSEHITRIGVSDAELARWLGVSRQTIFRWREGTTQRPRHREDVIDLAGKLRLTLEERDELLLAAGFRPDEPSPAPADELQALSLPEITGKTEIASTPAWSTRTRIALAGRWAAVLGGVIFIVALILLPTGLWPDVVAGLGIEVGPQAAATTWPRAAEAGETLVLVSEFANYGGEQIGYNVAGRIQEALQLEFREAGLEEVRVDRLPETIPDVDSANHRGKEYGAALVIWGEYDSGRVIAVTTAPYAEEMIGSRERRWLFTTAEELGATINTDLPMDVQWISLYILGRVHYWAERWEEAEAVLRRAVVHPPEDRKSEASIYFYLGLIGSKKVEPDLDAVIANYTEALERWPEFGLAWNNRGLAYLQRNAPGDLPRAEKDFRQAMVFNPRSSSAVLNLALALIQQDPGNLAEVLSLLEEGESLEPNSAGIQNGLCWYLSLSGDPEGALPHCDRAVELDPSGYSNDSRGLALALLGRYDEAAQEFRNFLAKLQPEGTEGYQRFTTTRRAWIEALEAGQNPFDEAILHSLLEE